jgi:hypothetical protein
VLRPQRLEKVKAPPPYPPTCRWCAKPLGAAPAVFGMHADCDREFRESVALRRSVAEK